MYISLFMGYRTLNIWIWSTNVVHTFSHLYVYTSLTGLIPEPQVRWCQSLHPLPESVAEKHKVSMSNRMGYTACTHCMFNFPTQFTNLRLPNKNPTIFLTGEVAFPLHGAIVLAFGLIQNDAHPFPRGKECGANVGYCAPLALPYYLHYRANLGEKRGWQQVIVLYTCIQLVLSFVCWVKKIRDLWSSTTLHCSCAAHFADQWAGQLEELGNTDGRNPAKEKRKLRTKKWLNLYLHSGDSWLDKTLACLFETKNINSLNMLITHWLSASGRQTECT